MDYITQGRKAQALKDYDYTKITKTYLKCYRDFKATIDNLKEEIEAQEHFLNAGPSAPIPKYGDDSGGGTNELTPAEAEAAKRIAIREKIESKRHEVERIERVIRKVDRALEALTTEDRQLVEGFYLQHKTWKELSIEHYMTEKWARVTAGRVVKRMAGMIFGSEALPFDGSM